MEPNQNSEPLSQLQPQIEQRPQQADGFHFVGPQPVESQLRVENISIQISENLQNNDFSTYEHQSALELVFKIVERSYSRHFLKRLTFSFIQSLKNEPKTIVIAAHRTWPFQELYQKPNRSADQQQMLEFVNLCATMIQSNFKGFITQKRHKLALQKSKKAKDKLIAFIKMWKVSRVYNCRRCVMERNQIKKIDEQRNIEEDNFTTRNPKKIKQLYKHYEIKTQMFRDAFYLLMETGAWTLEDNLKPRKYINKTGGFRAHQNFRASPPRPRYYQASTLEQRAEINQITKENLDVNKPVNYENNLSTFASYEEDRPIKAKGQYVLNQKQIQAQEVISKKQEPDNNEHELSSSRKEQIKKDTHKREKRKKYDPRKAIEEQKRRKKQNSEKTNDKVAQQVKVSVEKKAVNRIKTDNSLDQREDNSANKSALNQNERKKKTVIAKNPVKNVKKAAVSKVDCWGAKKDEQAEWVKECKTRLIEEKKKKEDQIQQNRSKEKRYEYARREYGSKQKSYENGNRWGKRIQQQERSVQKQEEPRGYQNSWQREQLGHLKQRQREQIGHLKQRQREQLDHLKQKQNEISANRKNSPRNLQEQVKNMVERNLAKKRQSHRTIDELQDAHHKHYGDRLQNLMPKLSLLAVARDEQYESGVPVIDNDCEQFGEWFHTIFNSTQFWNLASQLERVYKSFVLQ